MKMLPIVIFCTFISCAESEIAARSFGEESKKKSEDVEKTKCVITDEDNKKIDKINKKLEEAVDRLELKLTHTQQRLDQVLKRIELSDKNAGRIDKQQQEIKSAYNPFMQPLTTLQMLRRVAKATVEVEFSAEAATNSFGSANSREDLSSRVFGKKDIQLQDIALVTRLAAKGGILANIGAGHNNDDFAKLATEPVVFKAMAHKEQLQLGASAAFFEERLRFSAGLPVAAGTNQLRIDNDGSLNDKVKRRGLLPLQGDFANYTLSGFVDALVGNMNMKTGERVSTYGLGQAFIGASYLFDVENMKQAQLGVQVYLPTAPNPDTNRVWPVELAPNNLAFGVSGSLLYSHNRYLNPYVQADGRVNVSSKAPRRVARLVSGGGVANPTQKMALGSFVDWDRVPGHLGNNFKKESEAAVRGFSDFSSDVTWRVGESLTLQVGNIFEQIAGAGGYLDCAYRFSIKLRDQILEIRPIGAYDAEVFLANTDEFSHQLRVGYGYHFTNAFRLSAMTTLAFAGKNAPQTFGATVLFGFGF